MPSNEPIEEQVIQNLETTLEGISVGADYYTTVAKVIRYEEWQDDLLEYPAIMITALSSDMNNQVSLGQISGSMKVELTLVLESWDNQTRDASRFIADVQKALVVDVTRNSTAVDTRILEAERFMVIGDSPRVGATMLVEITYRHQRGDPYLAVS